MQLLHFHTLRSGVQANASPAHQKVLAEMAGRLRHQLERTAMFDTVEVEHTDDPDQLVVGLCLFGQPASEYSVADVVEQAWEEQISFPFWEIHTTSVDDGYVEFHGATRESAVGRFATVHVVAQRTPVPAQRRPQA